MTLSIHQSATLACMLDVTAPKPGNVHRGADFEDMTFLDFAKSAVAIGPEMELAPNRSIGQTVLQSIRATRLVTNTNTNLGIVLLFAPIAKAASSERSAMRTEIEKVLSQLTTDDARETFEAIRLACPGGLGDVDEMDVRSEQAPTDLIAAMEHASERDLVAKQYVTGFESVFSLASELVPLVDEHGLTLGIVSAYLGLLASEPDSLIRRKCGDEVAAEASMRANRAANAGKPGSEEWESSLAELDFWLRSDENRRNPGTSADLITAALFLCLLQQSIQLR